MTDLAVSGERAAVIAKGLSEAQRRALTSDGHAIPSMGPHGHDSVMLGFEHGRVAKALYARRLANLPFAPQILTPLGLAVRDHLRSHGGGER